MRKIIDLFTDFFGSRLGHHRVRVGKEFIKFCMVGLTNLAVHLTVYIVLTRLLSVYYILASVGAFMVAVTWSFFINKKWTFRRNDSNHKEQYIKFFIANAFVAVINIGILAFCVEVLKIYDLLSQLIASIIGSFINFTINKLWTFRD